MPSAGRWASVPAVAVPQRRPPEANGDVEAQMHVVEQLTALLLLIDFLFGIAFGVVGGAVFGSRRGALLPAASNDPLSAGAQVIYGVFVRDDDGYLQGLLPCGRPRSADPRGDDGSASCGQSRWHSHGQEVNW